MAIKSLNEQQIQQARDLRNAGNSCAVVVKLFKSQGIITSDETIRKWTLDTIKIEENRLKKIISCSKFRKKRPNHRKEYYTTNKDIINNNKLNRHRLLKNKIILHYSNGTMCCSLCSETRIGALTIDHIDGDGAEHRRIIGRKTGINFYHWLNKNKFPNGFRVLCMNCNAKQYFLQIRSKFSAKSLKLKQIIMNRLGGKCVKCNIDDLDILTIHHISKNGKEHRKTIANGYGGMTFYRKIIELDNYYDLECRCFSCNCEEEWRRT